MSSVLLLNDTSDQENWGCVATSTALKELVIQQTSSVQITSISLGNLRKEYRSYDLPLLRGKMYESFSGDIHRRGSTPVAHRLLTRLGLTSPINPFPPVPDVFDETARKWLDGNVTPVVAQFMQQAARSDLVLFNGEGSIYGQAHQGMRPLFMAYVAKRFLGKPVCVVNHSVHLQTHNPVFLSMARRVYPLMDEILVREPWSKRNLENLGVSTRAIVVPDALFSYPILNNLDLKRTDTGKYICVGGTSLAHQTSWNPRDAYIELVRKLQKMGSEVILVGKDIPDMFLRDVAKATDSAFFGPENTVADLFRLLSRATIFISGRYHPLIVASIVGCPFVPLNANIHKIEGLCELLDYPLQKPFDFFDFRNQVDDIIETVHMLIENFTSVSETLQCRSRELARASGVNAEVVRRYLPEN